MKHKLLCAVAVLALTAASAPAFAQAAPPPDVLPPHEIMTIVRSAGLNPTERPVRRGNTYVFRAIGAGGQEMRVTVDARYGDVMSVAPVANAAVSPRLPPPGVAMGPYERADRDDDEDAGPQRLSPPGIYSAPRQPAPGFYGSPRAQQALPELDDDDTVVYAPGAQPMPPGTVRPPAPVTAAPLAPPPAGQQQFYGGQPRMQTAAPPPYAPPPAPLAPQAPATTASIGEPQQSPGEGGLLPPPPERFPQRVPAPALNTKPAAKPAAQKPASAQPKPQQKTASNPPVKPPVPKPKPTTPAASTATPAPMPAAPPAKKTAADDVPH